MENEERVVYYCHSVKNTKETYKCTNAGEEVLYQIKILDQNNKDFIMGYLGVPFENDLLKFIVHIYIAK